MGAKASTVPIFAAENSPAGVLVLSLDWITGPVYLFGRCVLVY